MFTIAICDDDKKDRDEIQEMCNQYFSNYEQKYCVITFSNGMDLLEYRGKIDILFLDIVMPKMDGIETSKVLMTKGFDGHLIFVSAVSNRMPDAFKVLPFRYYLKPFSEERFVEAIEDAMIAQRLNVKSGKENIYIKQKGTIMSLDVNSIISIESLGDYTAVFLENEHHVFLKTLKFWEDIVDPSLFYRIHRACIASIKHISRVENHDVIMDNGKTLKASYRRIAGLMRKLKEYVK